MNKFATLALMGSLAAAPALSLADGTDNPSGIYLGGAVGRFNLDIQHLDDVPDAVQTIHHSDDNSWKAYLGYRFNPYLGLEADYINFGNNKDEFQATGSNGNYEVRLKGIAPALVLTLPLGPVEVFGKAGEYYYNEDSHIDFDNPGPRITSSHSRNDFMWGGGVGVVVLSHLALRAEYEKLEIDNGGNTDALWLGAGWRF
jgi:opacity protein-like surface antigen